MKHFRSNVGDDVADKVKDIYNRNVGKARQRKHALGRVTGRGINPAPAN